MKVLVGCEFSGTVRDAFSKKGHDAWSCDILPTESEQTKKEGKHIQDDVRRVLHKSWDIVIAHPSCRFTAVSGARWFKYRKAEQEDAIEFFMLFPDAAEKTSIEQPVSVLSTRYRKPDQIIQPWQFGHGETKATCLWLKNLPLLVPTEIVEGRESRIHKMPPSKDRGKLRSITYQGIAKAMADQWG